MRRRELLKGLLAAFGGAAAGFRLPFADAAGLHGQTFRLCAGRRRLGPRRASAIRRPIRRVEKVINHWAERDEVREAGNIAYAPFANNEAFFEKYYRRMPGD